MFRKMFLNLLLLAGLLLATASAWAGRCGSPPQTEDSHYNPQTDSYIVIEGEISGLPRTHYGAFPAFYNPFSPPSGCTIYTYVVKRQDTIHTYYCYTYIFKDTKNKRECWRYFTNLTSLNLRVGGIAVTTTRGRAPENWDANPSQRTVTLGPVQQTQ